MNYSEEVKATLWGLIEEMSLHVSDFTVNPNKDFTRTKKWDFATVIQFIISMESQTIKNELHGYLSGSECDESYCEYCPNYEICGK